MNNDIALNQRKSKILIVDDEHDNLIFLERMLKKEGYDVQSTNDGKSALKIAEVEKPDLILLDILMPTMDGYEVCRRLKANKNLSDIPVIFISALNDSKNIVMALESGGVDYITRPFENQEVTARVTTHLKLYQQSNELLEVNACLSDSKEQFKKFTSHLQTIREEERILLATEINDKVGQVLLGLKNDMRLWKEKIFLDHENSQSPELLSNFKELVDIVDNTLATTRKIMSGLKSDELESYGFVEAAKLYCIEFNKNNKINYQFKSSISKLDINEKQKIALYRIMQEALLNVSKHAHATEVSIDLNIVNNKFIMEITDNGIGFNEMQSTRPDSYGILSMKDRASLLGAELSINSEPHKGAQVRIEMPYVGKREDELTVV
jgi:signal transduction histidine kinase